ncbi:capsule O-acetyltransferase [Acinetobacter sp. ANC 5414]|nr:capsule O-acetyltransferase [Acinetobacter sp. ANC 5414]
MDVEEMKHIQTSKSVEKLELAYSGHGTSIPLTIPEGKTYDNLQSMYSKLNITENDFKELGGNKVGSLVDEIYEIYKNPVMRLSTFL